jgi:cell wall-associated NlpC family hydrolase
MLVFPRFVQRCGRWFGLAVVMVCTAACATPPVPQPLAPPPAAELRGDSLLHLLHQRGIVPMRDAASELVVAAFNFLGVPYRRAGSSPEEGFDCSGFTRHLVEQTIGLVLPRRAEQQAQEAGLRLVGRDELRPGDLVFFDTMRRAFSHVGIYVGEGRFIHSPRSGGQIRLESMGERYWHQRYNGARRIDIAQAPVAPPSLPDSDSN